MTGSTWTTKEEKAYLELNLPQYEAAQAVKKTALWCEEFEDKFIAKFPAYTNGTNDTPLGLVRKVSTSPTQRCVHSQPLFSASERG